MIFGFVDKDSASRKEKQKKRSFFQKCERTKQSEKSILFFRLGDSFDVATQAVVFGALYGTTAEKPFIFLGCQRLPVLTTHAEQSIGRLKGVFVRRRGKTIPRTSLLAAVAAIDVVA